MRRLFLLIVIAALVIPAAAQAPVVRLALLREPEMLTVIVQASEPVSVLDLRFEYVNEYDFEILQALRDYEQFRAAAANVTQACFVLRAHDTETPIPQECLSMARADLHVQELGEAGIFWFDTRINLQRPLTVLNTTSVISVCPAENPRCEFDYPYAPPGEAPAPPLLFDAADLENREILVLIADFEQMSGSLLEPHLEWERVLNNAIAETGVNGRAERIPTIIRSHEEAREAAGWYDATLVIWGYVGAAVVSSSYTVTPRWSRIEEQPSETEVIGTLDELSLFVSPGGDAKYIFDFVVAQLAYFADDYAAALEMIDRAIELAPLEREEEMGLGALYFYRGYTQDRLGASPEIVIDDYTRAVTLGVRLASAYNNRGTAYYALGDYDSAMLDYDQAIVLDPGDATPYNNRALIHIEAGDYERAFEDYDQAIALDPTYSTAYDNRGVAYVQSGEYAQAIADFDQAITFDPDYVSAYNNRGGVYEQQGDYDQAMADYDQAIALDPTLAEAFNNRGRLHYLMGEYRRALNDFDQAIMLDSAYLNAYNLRGSTYYALGDLKQAIEDFGRVIALDPLFADGYNNRGLAYADLGEYELAFDDYDQALALDPMSLIAYYNRGNAYYGIGAYELAIADFDQVIAIDPAHQWTYVNRGLAYYFLGNFYRAILNYDQALELNPMDSTAYNNRGWAYYFSNDFRAAYNDFARAADIDPNDANAYSGLVLANAAARRCTDAADALRTYLDLAGSDADPAIEQTYRQQCG